jgi:hypothetical protein
MKANSKIEVTVIKYRVVVRKLMMYKAYLLLNSTFVITGKLKIKRNANTFLLIFMIPGKVKIKSNTDLHLLIIVKIHIRRNR